MVAITAAQAAVWSAWTSPDPQSGMTVELSGAEVDRLGTPPSPSAPARFGQLLRNAHQDSPTASWEECILHAESFPGGDTGMQRNSHPPTFHLMILVALLGVSALAAGCGSITQAGPAAQGKDSTPQASSTVSQTATASGQLTGGQVTLTLDKQRYGARDSVVVTITNGL